MNLEKGAIYKIEYTKQNGEKTDREIISMVETPTVLQSMDVTDLNSMQKVLLQKKYREYCDYVNQFMNAMFSFKDWYSHTTDGSLDAVAKFRKFTMERIESIDDSELEVLLELSVDLTKRPENIQ